uniref:Zinc metalloproteinase n=1 Tax=Haemonchus contortus TaxID=6289 RepID=A0A7I4XXG6_HAECO
AIVTAIPEGESFTLTDLLQPHAHQRLFDTLSAIVASEYEGRPTSFDAASVIEHDVPSFSIKKLNEKYSSILFESDMVLHPDRLEEIVANSIPHRNRLRKRKAYVDYMYPRTIWSSGVPYSIHPSVYGRARENVVRAINFWQAETCINFRPRTNEQHFVEFIGNDVGCWSTVGKDEAIGRQVVSIGPGCEHFGVTSHELAHSLGVFHEQSRYDRDAVVQLNRNVVDPTLLFNFAKLSTYRLPYDVGSVMHYTPTEFSAFKQIPALTTVDPNLQQTMGQMEGPSFLDILVLNLHYNCQARCPRTLPCQNGGFIDSRTCNRCKCPTGFGGQLCNEIPPSFSKGCGGELIAYEAVRRFDINIKQIGQKRTKQCIYHLKAPQGKRLLVNIVQVHGRCVEGCWEDGVEFKMSNDVRPVGYRFCCQQAYQRRILSRTNIVPFIVTSRNTGISLTFEYTYVDAGAKFDYVEEETTTTTTTTTTAEPLQTMEILDTVNMETDGLTTTMARVA